MLALLQGHAAVETFDRARRANDGGVARQLLRVGRFLALCCRNRDLSLYLALSGGKGQIFDALYLLVGKLLGRRAFIHHHSFAYVDSTTLINKALFSLVRNQTHIVLSPGMGRSLARRYRLDAQKVMVVSNAAFYAQVGENPRAAAAADRASPLRVGFLSNITFDKGFVEFFEVLARLRFLHVPYRACIAGPVAQEAHQTFEQLRATASDVEYVGGLYGEAKDQFYRQLDILMFPTKYANEADPLVIHEALRAGVYVIACNRGAIADTLGNDVGTVLTQQTFVESAAQRIRTLSGDRDELLLRQRLAFEQACRLRDTGSTALATALAQIALNQPRSVS
jgi:glycosyltransferase involved in cell wall biosynthesis